MPAGAGCTNSMKGNEWSNDSIGAGQHSWVFTPRLFRGEKNKLSPAPFQRAEDKRVYFCDQTGCAGPLWDRQ